MSKVNTAERQRAMPIAVIGIACRFAGTATSPEGLWQMLSNNLDGWSDEAPDRFNLQSFWHPKPDIGGSFATRGLYLLKQNPAVFDADFFGIHNHEASAMDPQQRLLLEVAYEAIENAGIPLENLRGSDTAVYCSTSNCDYEIILSRSPETAPSHRFTGTGRSILANRISHAFNLKGPSIELDTACSSGLVATHEACKAIRAGESDMALVGAANLILDPEEVATMSASGVLSPHGRCYPFDSRANGFGRAEGVAMVVLKRLDHALRDGDCIRASIPGSALSQDGHTPGILMPSKPAQIAAIQRAYQEAALDPRDTVYVEAHGTGTQVGDRTEAEALSDVFCQQSRKNNKLLIGSVKANIGHTEPVAGLAGIIKSVLMLEKDMIPANIAFTSPRDDLPLAKWGLETPTKLRPWPETSPRRISINSFGYGGTNAHLIIERFPQKKKMGSDVSIDKENTNNEEVRSVRPDDEENRHRLFVFSHARAQGIRDVALRLESFIRERALSEDDLDNLSYTLASRRSRLDYRSSIVTQHTSELLQHLNDVANGVVRPQESTVHQAVNFVFTGQGAQWARMGADLLSLYPVFALSLERSTVWLRECGAGWDLLTELCKSESESQINDAELSQPCCTALQVALVDLLLSLGVQPDAVCGHSSGEIAAAYAAGFLEARDALRIAYLRGTAVKRLKKNWPQLEGGMLAVGLSVSDVKRYLDHSEGVVSIAAINSPRSVTLSGEKTALRSVQAKLTSNDIFNRMLFVDVAYHHAAHMERVRDEYVEEIGPHQPRQLQRAKMYSSVTGKEISGNELDAFYWGRNLVSPVQFTDALTQSLSQPSSSGAKGIVLEIGPHAALQGPIKDTMKDPLSRSPSIYQCLLVRSADAACTVLQAVGTLFQHGVKIDLEKAVSPSGTTLSRVLTSLPPYPWTHGRQHWLESRISKRYRQMRFPKHDLLGSPLSESTETDHSWRNYIDLKKLPWATGHRVTSHNAVPAAAYPCAIIEALRQRAIIEGHSLKSTVFHFRNLYVQKGLFLAEEQQNVEVVTSLRPYDNAEDLGSWKSFSVASITKTGELVQHCTGLVTCKSLNSASNVETFMEAAFQPSCPAQVPRLAQLNPKRFYAQTRSIGMSYTGAFASLREIHTTPGYARCIATIPDVRSVMPASHQEPHCIHPATLDTCFQTIFVLMQSSGALNAAVLDRIEELIISAGIPSRPGTRLAITGQSIGSPYKADISVRENKDTGPLVVQVKGVHMASQQELSLTADRTYCQRIEWCLDPVFANSTSLSKQVGASDSDEAVCRRNNLNDEFCRRVIGNVLANLLPEDEKKIRGHFLKFLEWMRMPGHSSRDPVTDAIRQDITPLGAVSEALLRFEHNIRPVLLSELDPMSLFLQDDLLARIYGNSPYDQINHRAATYFKLLEKKNPRMRVLEIGAGTATTTASILNHAYAEGRLCRLDRFVFTDISSGFFEVARKKLSNFAHVMDFRKLNIEESPQQQGFETGTFDLVIASNVLHATMSIDKSLRHVKSLLKPSGRLVLVELVLPDNGPLGLPFIFGMLPGWWLGQDEGRETSPLLSVPQWHDALVKSGFTGVDLELQDFPDYGHEISMVVSSVSSGPKVLAPCRLTVVSCAETNAVANELVRLVLEHNPEMDIQKGAIENVGPSNIYVVLPEMVHSLLVSCTNHQWENFKRIVSEGDTILWVTRGSLMESNDPSRALFHGLSRSIRAENHSVAIVMLELESTCDSVATRDRDAKNICDILQHFLKNEYESAPDFEFALQNDQVLIPRIVEDVKIHAYVKDSISAYHPALQPIKGNEVALQLHVDTPGLLDTLHWRGSTHHGRPPTGNEVRVQMRYLSLNFKDLMTCLGQLEGYSALLIEGAGVIVEVGESAREMYAVGDFVAGFSAESLATISNMDFRNVNHVPNGMTLEKAASIPVVYCTAYYSLVTVAQIQEGESVLIHSAAGAVGQAAVAIAQYLNVTNIFITVGSSEKRQFMTQNFNIPDENIFSSRDTMFKQGILRKTNGRGVDVVLNSLTGDAARESINLLAPFGRFVEIGKKDLLTNTRLEMLPLEKNITFATADLSMIARDKPEIFQKLLGTVFKLVESRRLPFIDPISVHSISKLNETLKIMQTGKHIGKLIMSIENDAQIPVQPQRPKPPTLNSEASYLVVGGTGGLGRAIIRHLASLGAKHIVTLSRTGSKSGEIKELVADLRFVGVELLVVKGSVTSMNDLQELRTRMNKRPVRGIIQGAMVLQDASFYNMTYKQWRAALDPKVTGTWNLHEVFNTSLHHFILLSSVVGICGDRGQANYSAGNSFQDAFARYRASLGLPVRSINLASVEGEGYVAENSAVMERMRTEGYQMQTLPELLAIINYALSNPVPDSVESAQIVCGAHFPRPNDEIQGRRLDARFSHTWTTTLGSGTTQPEISRVGDLSILRSATSSAQATDAVVVALNHKLARLLDASADDFAAHRSLYSYGLDSLIAVELRNWIAKELRAPLQTFELMSSMTLSELAGMIVRRSELVPAVVFQET